MLGNIRAMSGALELAQVQRSITVEDLCALHRELLAGTRDERWGGVVREEQNWIGGQNPCRAAYVPPPHEHVHDLLEDLCACISGDDHAPIVQAALVHAQFETIHPFVDGNGRVGRALIHLVLRRRGLAPNFVPPVSLILATNAGSYIAALVSYRYDAPADDPSAVRGAIQWLDRFVNEMLRACADALDFADQLGQLEQRWREAARPVRMNSATDALLSALPGLPILSVETAAAAIMRDRKPTNDAVNRLRDCGVLRQGTVGRRNRVFEVADLLDAITQFERRLASPAADTAVARPTRLVPPRPHGGRGRSPDHEMSRSGRAVERGMARQGVAELRRRLAQRRRGRHGDAVAGAGERAAGRGDLAGERRREVRLRHRCGQALASPPPARKHPSHAVA